MVGCNLSRTQGKDIGAEGVKGYAVDTAGEKHQGAHSHGAALAFDLLEVRVLVVSAPLQI